MLTWTGPAPKALPAAPGAACRCLPAIRIYKPPSSGLLHLLAQRLHLPIQHLASNQCHVTYELRLKSHPHPCSGHLVLVAQDVVLLSSLSIGCQLLADSETISLPSAPRRGDLSNPSSPPPSCSGSPAREKTEPYTAPPAELRTREPYPNTSPPRRLVSSAPPRSASPSTPWRCKTLGLERAAKSVLYFSHSFRMRISSSLTRCSLSALAIGPNDAERKGIAFRIYLKKKKII